MIFGTLWYMIEEMNADKIEHFELVEVEIDEEKPFGKAILEETNSKTKSNWHWDKEIDIWIKED